MRKTRAFLLAGWWYFAVLTPSVFAAGPFGSIHVGNWSGGAFTNDQTGAFSHCSAATGYANGVMLLIGQNAAGNWLLGFASPIFRLAPPETFPIDVTFDGQGQYHLFGTAINTNMVTSIVPSGAASDQMRKAHLMVAVAKGTTLQFDLNSTGKLLPVIANCVAKIKSGGIANAGDFSILPPPKPPAKPVVQTTATEATPPKPLKTVEVSGTGFVISGNGHVVTNHHVIGNCVGDIHGNLAGQSAVTLRIVSADETNDLALFRRHKQTSKTLYLFGQHQFILEMPLLPLATRFMDC
jgi:S1-C subfamily serine protease